MKSNKNRISLLLLLAATFVGNTILPMGNDNAATEAQEEFSVVLVPANQIPALEGQEGIQAIIPITDEEDAQLLTNETNPEKIKNCLLRVIEKAKHLTPDQKGTAMVAGIALVAGTGSFVADHVLKVYPAVSFIFYSMFGAALKGAIKDMNSKNKTKLAVGMLVGGVLIDYAVLPFFNIADHTAAALGLFTAATSMKKMIKATYKLFKEEKQPKDKKLKEERDLEAQTDEDEAYNNAESRLNGMEERVQRYGYEGLDNSDIAEYEAHQYKKNEHRNEGEEE